MKNRLFFLWMATILINAHSFSQTIEDKFQRPLDEVLIDIQNLYRVKLNYSSDLVEGKVLDYANWRFRPTAEETLRDVLSPFDMEAQDQGSSQFKIKYFEYHRRSVEDGRKWVEYLTSNYHNKSSWEERKANLKVCFLEALGIKGIPEWASLKPIVVNRRKHNGYVVENVALETLPGVYVTGSVYKPINIKEKAPVIVSPNGHFADGRYNSDTQARCAMLAQMGAIVMNYDLFAWGESALQFESESHRTSLAMVMQFLNGHRVLDYLLSLEDADPNRIGITGGSGGGSQTMLLSAMDSRYSVSVPAVMLSSYHSGGCPCESGRSIHLCNGGTSNVEIAAMMAPKPSLIISDGGDWTAHVPEIEFPAVQRIYGFYGKEEMVKNVHLPTEGHDYGFNKRTAMYDFMVEHLQLTTIKDVKGNWDESKCVIENMAEMYVFGNSREQLPNEALQTFNELEILFSSMFE